mmetsp:Transcript_24339/g.24946  ORF Transcript_24339/g.24946 Transcript_24339/m.24946 type:complete len:277 (-) Transcript_24339:211-1041(-)|eukprot:CAMPEP_0174825686 /NCGR_PEP_ID=MMETSP1107-20130205/42999_1 /TAXON_ID=36770 /ORGANISM="Paraphysomonas vestita, Strain GFlagA" /LENGTH=276 /DNA_ID=CAMNT_0016057529 /DNA_START=1152 /DNA_END=1982 /DNA_ORIENTATION=+
MSLPLYKDFNKVVTDLLNDDYDFKHFLKVKTKAPQGVTLTTTTELNSNGGKVSVGGKVSAKWAHESGFALDKLEVKNNGSVVVETSLTGVAPGLKFEFKGDDSNKGDLGVVYKQQQYTAAAEVDVAEFSAAKASVLAGTGPYTGGASATVSLGDKVDFKSFDVAGSYSVSQKYFAGLSVTDKFSKYGLSLAYFGGGAYTLAGLFDFKPETSAKLLTFGGAYKCNPNTNIKAKVNSNGIVSASVKQSLSTDASVTFATEIPTNDFSAYKFGITASLG